MFFQELVTHGAVANGFLDAKPLFSKMAIRDLDTGFGAIGMNDWYPVEFDDFSVSPAPGSNWAPKSACSAAKAGDALSATKCAANGLPVADQVGLHLMLQPLNNSGDHHS